MKTTLSIRSANLLFLLTMVLVLTVGTVIQILDLSAGLIGTEVLLILLPALLFLMSKRLPLKEGLRLNPISPLTALLSVLLGFTIFLFSVFIETVMIQLTGMMPVSLPEDSMPGGVLDSILYFIALAVFAPVCEEILFRGVIQSTYEERRTVRFTITITALLFAFYHFRLTGLPALLPVAFILGFVAWRTRSIYASILVHFGMNATSAANSLVAIHINGTGLPLISPWLALAGVLASVVLILVICQLHPAPTDVVMNDRPAKITPAPRTGWFWNYWPLLIAGLLYLGVAGLTLAYELSPEMRASSDLVFSIPNMDGEVISHYQITNRGGDVVGEMECQQVPGKTTLHLDCARTVEGFEIQTASSYFKDVDHTASWSATWDVDSMTLLEYSFERQNSDGTGYRAELGDDLLVMTMDDSTMAADMPGSALIEYEWPWRMMFLQTQAGDVWEVSFGDLLWWDETAGKSVTTQRVEYLLVSEDGTLTVPAGDFTVMEFSLGSQNASYAPDDGSGFRLIQFDDGMLVYSLVE